jgi:transcriptional regulator with XRE-family HTH domain
MGDVIAFPPHERSEETPAEPLWREVVGRELRAERHRQERTLSEVAERAGVSTQYLSEIERGLKDPSSELLAAVHGALGLHLVDLTGLVTHSIEQPSGGTLCLAV